MTDWGCGSNEDVNPERAVNQRIRGFWRGFLGCESNHDGCLRAPDSRTRTGENGAVRGCARKPLRSTAYARTPRTLALGVPR